MSNDVKRRPIPRIGIVLTGGGMRGSFQAGVLEGMDSSGMNISVLSGTSAGALNAFSFTRAGSKATSEKWRTLSNRNFLTINILGLLVRATLLLFSLRHIVWMKLIHGREHVSPNIDRITRSATWLRYFIEEWELDQPPLARYVNRTTAKAQELSFFIGFLPVLILAILFYYLSIYLFYMFIALVVFVYLFSKVIWWVANIKGLNAVSTKLREVISSIPNQRSNAIPTFVCLSVPKRGFDYKTMRGYYFTGIAMTSQGYFRSIVRGEVDSTERNILSPLHVRIDNIKSDEQIDAVVASAALSLGLIGCVFYGETFAFDGGVVDNIPINPVLDEEVDCIVVVDITRYGIGNTFREILSCHAGQVDYLEKITGDVDGLLRRGKLMCKAASRYFISFDRTYERINRKLDNLLDLHVAPQLPKVFIVKPKIKLPWYSLLYISRNDTEALIESGITEGKKVSHLVNEYFENGLVYSHEQV